MSTREQMLEQALQEAIDAGMFEYHDRPDLNGNYWEDCRKCRAYKQAEAALAASPAPATCGLCGESTEHKCKLENLGGRAETAIDKAMWDK